VFQRAVLHCESAEKPVLDITDILVSLIDEQKNYCSYYMRRGGLDRLILLEVISHGILSVDDEGGLIPGAENEGFSGASKGELPMRQNPLASGKKSDSLPEGDSPDSLPDEDEGNGKQKSTKRSVLERYTVELTAQAKAGKLKHRDEDRPVTVEEIESALSDLRRLTQGGIAGGPGGG